MEVKNFRFETNDSDLKYRIVKSLRSDGNLQNDDFISSLHHCFKRFICTKVHRPLVKNLM